ncbi:hypothetical protein CRENBAI_012636 [Crenichthys baileyi]|uniref:Metalloendopeptidase n=1 Tax=Crenichthys baileyi TaxID=28760 RepID=A0AAV9S764_9TELE
MIQTGPWEGEQVALDQTGEIARAAARPESDPEIQIPLQVVPKGVSSKELEATGQVITTAEGKTLRRRCAGEPPSYSPPADEATMCTCQTLETPAPAPLSGGRRCWSYIGRQKGGQKISLKRKGCLSRSTIQHEVLHALGFNHEQVCSDRDKYVRILYKNIKPGLEHNFQKKEANNLGTPYDFSSVMQYPNHAFSKNGKPTIVAKCNPKLKFGHAKQMSVNDIIRIKKLYNSRRRGQEPCLGKDIEILPFPLLLKEVKKTFRGSKLVLALCGTAPVTEDPTSASAMISDSQATLAVPSSSRGRQQCQRDTSVLFPEGLALASTFLLPLEFPTSPQAFCFCASSASLFLPLVPPASKVPASLPKPATIAPSL